jgi:hypothetical protein
MGTKTVGAWPVLFSTYSNSLLLLQPIPENTCYSDLRDLAGLEGERLLVSILRKMFKLKGEVSLPSMNYRSGFDAACRLLQNLKMTVRLHAHPSLLEKRR